jgi:hypothetical protein
MAVSDLQTGMRLREDVTDRHGRLIIAAGTTLHERHLRALKLWGIAEVRVHGDSLVPPPSREPPDSLYGLFALSDLSHPMIVRSFIASNCEGRSCVRASPMKPNRFAGLRSTSPRTYRRNRPSKTPPIRRPIACSIGFARRPRYPRCRPFMTA